MNHYQRSRSGYGAACIKMANVSFANVGMDANLSALISRLKVCFSELDKYLLHDMALHEIKSKSIEINSLIDVLIDSTRDIDADLRTQFVKNLIESCVAIIAKYKEAERREGFDSRLKQYIASRCKTLFDRECGKHLNYQFWQSLLYYEWLSKEGLLTNGRRFRHHSDEQLEQFFIKNRKSVLQKMLAETRGQGNLLSVESPLHDQQVEQSFQLYKMLPTVG